MFNPTQDDFVIAKTYLLCDLPTPFYVVDIETWLDEYDHDHYRKMWNSNSEIDRAYVRDLYNEEMRVYTAYNMMLDKCIAAIRSM